MIKAIIFDCFGVMVGNPIKRLADDLEATGASNAQDFRAVMHAADRGIMPDDEVLKLQAKVLNISEADFAELRDKGETRNDELINYLITLKKNYKIGFLSNISSRERLDDHFEPGQLDELFDTVVASGVEGYVKPEPEIYKLTAARLGLSPEECVMVDDLESYCQGARDVGMQAIRFVSNSQCIRDLNALIDRGGENS